MKEIIAIIRPRKMAATRTALESIGHPSMTAVSVLGRGRQRGIAGEVSVDIKPDMYSQGKSSGMKYVPKRLLSVMVPDDDVEGVVEIIIRMNQSGQIGDGKVFVCPVDEVIRVRTNERGDLAVL